MTVAKALDIYYEHFGENYPLMITDQLTEDEIIEDIKKCIEANKPSEPVEYEEDEVY